MLSSLRGHVRGSILVLGIVAIAATGCTSSGSKATTGGGGGGGGGGNGATADLSKASKNLSSITSYKFRMEMAGGTYGSTLGALGGGGDDSKSFVATGTFVTKPQKAIHLAIGDWEVIEIGDKSYSNLLGSWEEDKDGSSGFADSFAPETMLTGYSGLGWKSAGDGNKNGVAASHYTVSAADMGIFGTSMGVTGKVDWVCEVWIAKSGGYPVNLTVTAQGSDKSYAFKYIMDITNVNDAANKVEAPI